MYLTKIHNIFVAVFANLFIQTILNFRCYNLRDLLNLWDSFEMAFRIQIAEEFKSFKWKLQLSWFCGKETRELQKMRKRTGIMQIQHFWMILRARISQCWSSMCLQKSLTSVRKSVDTCKSDRIIEWIQKLYQFWYHEVIDLFSVQKLADICKSNRTIENLYI